MDMTAVLVTILAHPFQVLLGVVVIVEVVGVALSKLTKRRVLRSERDLRVVASA